VYQFVAYLFNPHPIILSLAYDIIFKFKDLPLIVLMHIALQLGKKFLA
jgi:hypothetical protein